MILLQLLINIISKALIKMPFAVLCSNSLLDKAFHHRKKLLKAQDCLSRGKQSFCRELIKHRK